MPLTPGSFAPDFARIAAAVTKRTRAIIVNTPHNPSATVWSAAQMAQLAELLRGSGIFVVADEVYEHMVFDGEAHQSVARWPELAARSFVVSSFGKTYHVTGWKVGYVAAPAALMTEFRKVHQFNVFTVNTPMQHGLASFMRDATHHTSLPAFYQRKRDLFAAGLARTRLRALQTQGSYFQCVDYSAVSDLPAYRELLLLYAILRDLAALDSADPKAHVDLLLPLNDEPGAEPITGLVATTRTTDFQPSDLTTTTLDLDVSLEPAAEPATALGAEGSAPPPGARAFKRDSRFIDFDAEGTASPLRPGSGSLR